MCKGKLNAENDIQLQIPKKENLKIRELYHVYVLENNIKGLELSKTFIDAIHLSSISIRGPKGFNIEKNIISTAGAGTMRSLHRKSKPHMQTKLIQDKSQI